MNSQNLFHDDIYDALEQLTAALGGYKRVGYEIWPDLGPEKAGQRLRDCLNPNHKARLDLFDFIRLVRMGNYAGVHDAMWRVCDDTGYQRPEPINPDERRAEIGKQVVSSIDRLEGLLDEFRKAGADIPVLREVRS